VIFEPNVRTEARQENTPGYVTGSSTADFLKCRLLGCCCNRFIGFVDLLLVIGAKIRCKASLSGSRT
jgi:hypothetical protein